MTTAREFAVEIVTSLDAVRSRWEALERTGEATPFQSFTWVSALCSTVGRHLSAEPFVVVVSEISSGRDLVILPLVRHRFGPATVIGPPDFGISDYSAPIIARELISAPDRFCSIWRQAMAELPSADLFHVSKIPRCIGRHSNPLLSWPGLRRKVTRSWSVELPDSWAHYESLLSSKARGAFRRYHRRLQEIGSVTHVVADDDVSAGRIFDALCAHREARFSKLGRPDILRSAPHREFYREVIQRSLTSGPALLSALMVDSEIVATMLGLRWRDTYMALIPTMAEGDAFQKYGVGKLMNWLQMKEMHARGCRHFDFTIGNEPYKRDYGAQPRELYDMVQPLKVQGYPLAWAFRIRAGLQLWREAAPPVS